MRIDIKKVADTVVAHCEGKTAAQIKTTMKDVVAFLAGHDLLRKWRAFEAAIDAAWARRYGASQVTVVSAHTLTSTARTTLEAAAPGATLTEVVDERLIGGAVVRLDNTRIDGSITGALMRLKNAMYSEV